MLIADIETDVIRGPAESTLEDGTVLFTKRTRTTIRRPRRVILNGEELVMDFGSVNMGEPEEWCRHPDGREERCSHRAVLMRSVQQPKKESVAPKVGRKSWLARKLCAFLGHNWDCVEYAGPVNLPWGTKYRCKRCESGGTT